MVGGMTGRAAVIETIIRWSLNNRFLILLLTGCQASLAKPPNMVPI